MSHSVDECYDVYNREIRKARKEHRCGACQRPIKPGDFYCSVHIVFDGEAETIKRCGACETIHKHLAVLGDGEMWPDERLGCGLDYEEEWGGPPPDEIAALPFEPDVGQLLAAEKKPRRLHGK